VGSDILLGADGDDVLIGGGGVGQDHLTGGAGNDRFVLEAAQDSAGHSGDFIKDFLIGSDVIDLAAIDADVAAAGDQAFTFIGAAAFSHQAGELQAKFFGDGTLVSGDIDGDGRADFQVSLDDPLTLQASDFRL
jgi:Ca2+-binding RTX toxin-like protein